MTCSREWRDRSTKERYAKHLRPRLFSRREHTSKEMWTKVARCVRASSLRLGNQLSHAVCPSDWRAEISHAGREQEEHEPAVYAEIRFDVQDLLTWEWRCMPTLFYMQRKA